MPSNSTSSDSTSGPDENSVYVDNLCRLIVGKLHSSPHMYPKAAEHYLEKLKATRLSANARKGSGGQWFGALESTQGEILVLSDTLTSHKDALDAANEALTLLRT